MLVQGVVVSFTPQTKVKKQGGGTYDAWQLIYRTTDNEVKDVTKPIQGLRFNASLKNGLESLSVGDEFTLVMERNANGYFDVKSVEKGIKDVQETSKEPDGNRAPVRSGKVTGSNYETPEERAKRQVLIVRQSSVSNALDFAKISMKDPVTLEDILAWAKEIEKHVFKDFSKVAKKYMEVKLEGDE